MNLLFYKGGFSFFVQSEQKNKGKVQTFEVSQPNLWEEEVCKELETNLALRRNFKEVRACFLSSFYSLVPTTYKDENAETLLNFSEAEFEENQLLTGSSRWDAHFVYGTSQALMECLSKQYDHLNFFHSGQVFLSALDEKAGEVHLNLFKGNLEVAVLEEGKLVFYNLFDSPTDEDVLFYTLFAIEQLNLETNKMKLVTYGDLKPSTSAYGTLRKYIRNLSPVSKDETVMDNFTLLNLEKCV